MDGDAEGVSVIENAPGRGYAFVAELSWKERPLPKDQEGAGLEVGNALDHNIPLPLTGLIGRERDLALVEEKLASRRLVSVVGPGGIGKTRIAAEAALAIAERGMLRACFVDFSPLESGEYVTGAIAAALHLHEDENVPAEQRIIRSLRSRDTLLERNPFTLHHILRQ